MARPYLTRAKAGCAVPAHPSQPRAQKDGLHDCATIGQSLLASVRGASIHRERS